METIDEIVADMRKRFEPYAKSDSNDARYVAYLGYAEFADRIEQVVTNCNQLKMREALVELIANIEMRSFTFGLNVMVDTKTFLDAKKALSAPPRNCDIGSAAEQYKRWEQFCLKIKWCVDCKLNGDGGYAKCFLKFLRMPYNKDEAK